jgi:hypothetical protein
MLHEGQAAESWAEALEEGHIVRFARCPIALPDEEEQRFLREGLAPHLRKKNVSFYPSADRLTGLDAPPEVIRRAHEILEAHARRVRAFLERSMPELTRGWTVGTSSFRPMEERGRGLSAHASNELIHVDAGAYGATHGDRILRFFVNLNPDRDRVWISKGSFAELWRRHAREAGLPSGSLEPALPERMWSGALRGISRAFPLARVVDSSPYDRRMRQFHNWMKETPEFQAPPHEEFRFAPGSAWMVMTDGVSHACIEGQHALVDTFLVPLRNCQRPAPYHYLSGHAA